MKKAGLIFCVVLSFFFAPNAFAQDLIYAGIDNELSDEQRAQLEKADELVQKAEKNTKSADEIDKKYEKFEKNKKKYDKKTWESKQQRILAEKNYEKSYETIHEVYSDLINKLEFRYKADGDQAKSLDEQSNADFSDAKEKLSQYKNKDKGDLKKVKYDKLKSDLASSHDLKINGINKQIDALKLYVAQTDKIKRDQEDKLAWDDAADVNTVDSYTGYLSKFPKGKFVAEANQRLQQLKDEEEKQKTMGESGDLVFKVQIGASHIQLSDAVLRQRAPGAKNIEMVYVDGWYKYRAGEYKNYKEAAAYAKSLKRPKDAFVVVFRNGMQIDVTDEMKNK
jgi:hypothetical protein